MGPKKLPIRPRELLPEPEPTPSPKEDPPSLLTRRPSRKRLRPSRKPSPLTRLSSSTPLTTVTLPLLRALNGMKRHLVVEKPYLQHSWVDILLCLIRKTNL